MKKLRIIFAGTPAFAAPALNGLLEVSWCEVCAVLTQPDRPVGRGQNLQFSPVKQLALKNDLTLLQPTSLKDPSIINILKAYEPDLMVVVAYGMLIPFQILNLPKGGCINIHASLLPRWRGAAPIQYALLAGDEYTGVTIMQMNTGLDTGPILKQEKCQIEPNYTSGQLFRLLSEMGKKLIIETLENYRNDKLIFSDQNNELATYAPKIDKSQAKLDWTLPAFKLDRQVRAFNPWPIAFSFLETDNIRIWETKALEGNHSTPGEIINVSSQGIDVATGEGLLRILSAQFPGKKAHTAAELLNAYKKQLSPGKFFHS